MSQPWAPLSLDQSPLRNVPEDALAVLWERLRAGDRAGARRTAIAQLRAEREKWVQKQERAATARAKRAEKVTLPSDLHARIAYLGGYGPQPAAPPPATPAPEPEDGEDMDD